MSTKVIIGCDPGCNGALAVLRDSVLLEVYDLKDYYTFTGGFRSLDPILFNKLIGNVIPYEYEPEDVSVFCEESLNFGKDSSRATSSIFDSRGVLRAVIIPRGWKMTFVPPQAWKRRFGLLKTYKSASVEKACELFPGHENLFKRPKRGGGEMLLDGRAEAALIALYGFHLLRERRQRNDR